MSGVGTDDVVTATVERFELAEGLWWDAATHELWWVDIAGKALLTGHLLDGRIEVVRRRDFPTEVSAVATSASGEVVLALRDRLAWLDGRGVLVDGPVLIEDASRRRLNDGGPDPHGQFVVGTLATSDTSHDEELVRWRAAGEVEVLDSGLRLSNGIAYSVDGRCMYSVDTLRSVVYRRSYDLATGEVGPRTTFATVQDGLPDGIAVDVEDHVWVAVWGAGEVQRLSPGGSVVARLRVPVPHVSNVAFAGPDLETLVISTARHELTEAERRSYPLAGALFTTRPGVRGLATTPWAGPPGFDD